MKKSFLLLIFLVGGLSLWSQTSKAYVPQYIPSNYERLGYDYEIKDVPNPDHAKIVLLNLDYYDSQRLQNADREIYDSITNYTIIVYGLHRALEVPIPSQTINRTENTHNE